ncbi:protein indeterminate-domain 7-like [Senna tora]|uniref:Protein indeterminate-domain 7-like n=1 Tax=Senna tora TaxID=362788 RepID=A0A834U0M9_9FABA|nr:protein indeterminate-domain 7-like [Senna tora]
MRSASSTHRHRCRRGAGSSFFSITVLVRRSSPFGSPLFLFGHSVLQQEFDGEKHREKKLKCDKCSKPYAVQSDWKAHSKICGTKGNVGLIFTNLQYICAKAKKLKCSCASRECNERVNCKSSSHFSFPSIKFDELIELGIALLGVMSMIQREEASTSVQEDLSYLLDILEWAKCSGGNV